MLQNPMVLALLYFAVALIFALIYFVVWSIHPDAFIIHQELNLRPFKLWPTLGAFTRKDQKESPPPASPVSVETINSQCLKLSDEESGLLTQLATVEPALSKARQDVQTLGTSHNSEMANNMMASLEQQKREFDTGVHQALEELKSKLAVDPGESERIRIGKEFDEQIAKLEEGHGARHPSLDQSAKTSVVNELEAALALRDRLDQEQRDLSSMISKLQTQRRELLQKWRDERLSRIGLFDFVYFSMGVATCNTFGDLIPNDRIIRIIIVVQLLLSILLVGLFVNAIASS